MGMFSDDEYDYFAWEAENAKAMKYKDTLLSIREICEPYRDLPIHEFVVILQKCDEVLNDL